MKPATKKPTAPSMMDWQYKTILSELSQVTLHASDDSCPCNQVALDPPEYCLGKHLLNVASLGQETALMDEPHADMLAAMATEANEYHEKAKTIYCKGGVWPDLAQWSRDWRKKMERLYYACSTKKAKVHDVAALFDSIPVRITGTCKDDGCGFKVTATEKVEGSAVSIKKIPGAIEQVRQMFSKRAAGTSKPSPRTFAPGISTSNRYEFEFKIVEAKDLIVSHDPFTFEPNPKYAAKIQPRIRERLANQMQVKKIAAHLDPEKLLLDTKAIDTGSPIVGPDNIVECGNGRVMALMLAEKEHPANIELYKRALKEVAASYGLPAAGVDKMKMPVLVRLRLTPTDRQKFAEECNARPTIETSAIEKARTDADKITPAMLQSLDILEGEPIERALRSERNKPFVSAYLSKVPENEQAGLIDSRGFLSSDGIRRMVMGIFTATFKGDTGIKLAEKFFEAIDETGVKNAFNGILRSLGIMAQAENLVASGNREPGLTIGEDLAKAMTVFSNLRGADMPVSNYLAQAQMIERQLTPFQEVVLKTLDEHTRSAKRVGNILSYYAQAVIDSPPPGQVQMIPGPKPDKARLFAGAVKRVAEEAEAERIEREAKKKQVAAVAELFDTLIATDNSVRDLPQQARITNETITVISKVGSQKAGKYSFPLSEWLATANHPNPMWAKSEVLRKYYKDYDEEGVNPDRMIDSQRRAIDKALAKKMVTPVSIPKPKPEVLNVPAVAEAMRMKLNQGTILVDSNGERFEIETIDTTYGQGADWVYTIKRLRDGSYFHTKLSDIPTFFKIEGEQKLGQARLFDYSFLAKKIDACNMAVRDVDAALSWRPLRNLVSAAVGAGASVKLCAAGLVYGNYQVIIDGLTINAEKRIIDLVMKSPGIRQVYTAVPRQKVFEAIKPAVKPEPGELRWTPQEVVQPRGERGEQVAMFEKKTADKFSYWRIHYRDRDYAILKTTDDKDKVIFTVTKYDHDQREFAKPTGEVFYNQEDAKVEMWHQRARLDDVCHLFDTRRPPKEQLPLFPTGPIVQVVPTPPTSPSAPEILTEVKRAESRPFTFILYSNGGIRAMVSGAFMPDQDFQRRPWLLEEARQALGQVPGKPAPTPIVEIPISPDLSGLWSRSKFVPFPYQQEGVAWLKGRHAALLADDMGLGKTNQAIFWACDYKPCLVVCPAAIILNWMKEIKEIWRPQDTAYLLHGDVPFPKKLSDYTVTSYGSVEKYLPELRRAGFKSIIIDEAHLVKNLDTARTKNILALVDPEAEEPGDLVIPNKLAVTGTPVLNRPIEIFALMVFLGVKKRYEFRGFLREYTEYKTVKGRMVFTGAKNLDGLNALLKTFMLRRLKPDVLKQLPPKINTPLFVPITNAAEYKEAEMNFLGWLRETAGDEAAARAANAEIIARMNALRRLSAIGKVQPVSDWIKPCYDGQGKIIVFSNFLEPLKALSQMKSTETSPVIPYTGGLSPEERQAQVEKFQSDPKQCYFMGTTGAAGVGITLTKANRVVFLDLPWTPGGKMQAEDRAHRIGQTRSVEIVNVLAKGTIDERMLTLLQNKEEIIAQAVDGKTADEAARTSVAQELMQQFLTGPALSDPVQYEPEMADVIPEFITEEQANILQGLRDPGAELFADKGEYAIDRETGKMVLYFDKASYMALPLDLKDKVKSYFLFSRSRGAWISKGKANSWAPQDIVKRLGFESRGEEGEKQSFAERIEKKAERAEQKAERCQIYAENAAQRSQQLKADWRKYSQDIAFVTQPNVSSSGGRRFTNFRNKVLARFDKGIEEGNKADYFAEKAEKLCKAAELPQLKSRRYLDNRIREGEAELRKIERDSTEYESLGREVPERLHERAEDELEKLVFYKKALDELGGIAYNQENVHKGDSVKIRHGWAIVKGTGPKNLTVVIAEGGARGMELKYSYAEIQEHQPSKPITTALAVIPQPLPKVEAVTPKELVYGQARLFEVRRLFDRILEPCEQARNAYVLYQGDVKAGHDRAAEYWKGQGDAYSSICVGEVPRTEANMEDSTKALKITGVCDTEDLRECQFKVTQPGKTAHAQGINELAKVIKGDTKLSDADLAAPTKKSLEAAAPDMLEALYQAKEVMEISQVIHAMQPEVGNEPYLKIVAAINKAEGKTKLSDSAHPYAHPVPKEIIVFKTTIEKHYIAADSCQPQTFRRFKPEPNIVITVCCPRGKTLNQSRTACTDGSRLVMAKSIVPNDAKHRAEVEKWKAKGVKVSYRTNETGEEPQAKVRDPELAETVAAIKSAEVINA